MSILSRFRDLEQVGTDTVRGLCEDVTNSKLQKLQSDLKAFSTDVQNLQCKQETSKTRIRDLEVQLKDHVCVAKCDCETEICGTAIKKLQLETCSDEKRTLIEKLQEVMCNLRRPVKDKENQLETARQVIQECTDRNATIEENLRSTEVKFQKRKKKQDS